MPEFAFWIGTPFVVAFLLLWKWLRDWKRLAQTYPGPYPQNGIEDDSLTFAISGWPPIPIKNSIKIKVNETSLSVLPYSAVGWCVKLPVFSIPWKSIKSCTVSGSVISVAVVELEETSTKLYIQGDAADLVKEWHSRMSGNTSNQEDTPAKNRRCSPTTFTQHNRTGT